MNKSIDNGINTLVAKLANNNKYKQWRTLRIQLDNILIVNNLMSTDETRKKCVHIDSLDLDGRKSYINNTWGSNYLTRCIPLLLQLDILEK